MERKTFDLEIKAIDDDKGEVTAYLATFGNVDHGGDRIVKGAFAKSIKARPSIPMISQHIHPSGAGVAPANQVVIGKWNNLAEDDYGLLSKGKVNLKTQAGREHFELLKSGDLDKFSIGYETKDSGHSTVEGKSVRDLKELDLHEGSIVIFPMNDQASVVAVKAADPEPTEPDAQPEVDAEADEKAQELDVEHALAVLEHFVVKFGTETFEGKAGRRNSAADQSRVQLLHDMATQMHEHAAALGADHNSECGVEPGVDGMDNSHRLLPMTMKQAAELIGRAVANRL